MSEIPKCDMCKRERTLADSYDYSPLQAIMGEALGWYSADDGEICGGCMTELIRKSNA